jgi:catechol 2,3-dioxygenase-like lactoylglutathione lyase family enzyme
MFKRIDHVEIVPSNVEKTLDYYQNILGFELKGRVQVNAPPMKEVIYLMLGDTKIEIISAERPAMKSEEAYQVGYRAIALEVEDMGNAVGYLREKGIEMARGPVDLGTSVRGEIRDPDGLTVELRQWK